MNENRIITLIEQAREGNREAQGELIKQFEPTVFAVVLSRLRNECDDLFFVCSATNFGGFGENHQWLWLSQYSFV